MKTIFSFALLLIFILVSFSFIEKSSHTDYSKENKKTFFSNKRNIQDVMLYTYHAKSTWESPDFFSNQFNLGINNASANEREFISSPLLASNVKANAANNIEDFVCWGYVITESTKNCYISSVVKVKFAFRVNQAPSNERAYPDSDVVHNVENQFKGAIIEEYPSQKNMLGSTRSQFFKTEADASKYRRQEFTSGCMKGEFKIISFSYSQN